MPRRSRASPTSIVAKAAELSVAVPQVVAHRVTRMALAGPGALSPRDTSCQGLNLAMGFLAVSR